MKITIETDSISLVELLTPSEVVEQLVAMNAIELNDDEEIRNIEVSDQTICFEVFRKIEDDPRCSGYRLRSGSFSMPELCEHFTASAYYAWSKGEDDNDYLCCFGC